MRRRQIKALYTRDALLYNYQQFVVSFETYVSALLQIFL